MEEPKRRASLDLSWQIGAGYLKEIGVADVYDGENIPMNAPQKVRSVGKVARGDNGSKKVLFCKQAENKKSIKEMKTKYSSKEIAGTWCLITAVFSMLVCSPECARAQELGVCTDQVLSAPTESSVRVRVTGVNQWPVNPICLWSFSGIAADGTGYRWSATLIGDGLVDTYVNAAVIFVYQTDANPTGTRLVFNCFCPYPSDGFSMPVVSDPASRTPPEGAEGSWSELGNESGFLSFKGVISLDARGNLKVDMVFTGGTPPPPSISDLIGWVNGSGLSQQQKRPLVATLQGASSALASGDCETAINKLEAFQNKVRAQVAGSDPVLADILITGAQEIIDSACGD